MKLPTYTCATPVAIACLLALTPSLITRAQAQSAPPTGTEARARDLARYDKNHNGAIDPDERAEMQATEARLAREMDSGTAAGGNESDEVVHLSPFEVTTANDQGYRAQNSLSGTRLNSNLEDIAGSVSVVTKQQLIDTAAIDINDIFLYEVGTEGTGQYTDLSNDGRGEYDNVSGNPNTSNRMRGLSAANIADGGFASSSSIPLDTYNIDSVEIARGPNSNLAGLSEAGGTVNIVRSSAKTNKDSNQVLTRFDSYGGGRASIDINRVLVKDKLAVRVSALYNEGAFIRKPSIDRTDRQQLALTFRPFKSTTLKASYERFNEYAQRANTITPKDTISLWRANGSPTWDAEPGNVTYTVNGVRSAPVTAMPANLGIGFTTQTPRLLQMIDNNQIEYIMLAAAPVNAALKTGSLQRWTINSNESTLPGGLFKIPGVSDKSLYDWTDVNLSAANVERQQARTLNVSLDQTVIDTRRQRLTANLAYRGEDQDRYTRTLIGQQDGVGNTLYMDTNARLVDGRVNPNFLHPYIGNPNGTLPQTYKRPSKSDNFRGQLAYLLDLRQEPNILKWLGMHRINGFGEYGQLISNRSGARYNDVVVDNPHFQPGLLLSPIPNISTTTSAVVTPLYYVGSTPGGGVEYAPSNLADHEGNYVASYLSPTGAAWNYADPVELREKLFSVQNQERKLTRTLGFSTQSFLLHDQVVATFGFRRDRTFAENNLPLTTVNGFFDETNLYNFGVSPKYRDGNTRTKGLVAKPFRGLQALTKAANDGQGLTRFGAQFVHGLNFHYNTSNSFLPVETAYDLYLNELPNPRGESKEYGFSLNLFDEKFVMRVTHYETTQFASRAATQVIARRALSLDIRTNTQDRSFQLTRAATGWQAGLNPQFTADQALTAALTQIGYTRDYYDNINSPGRVLGDTSDAVSKGWEVETQFNPNKFWTMKATGSQMEATDANISGIIQRFIDDRMPTWTSIRVPTALQANGQQLPNAGALWWSLPNGSDGSPENWFNSNVRAALLPLIANQGKRKPQTSEYRFSVITNYKLAGIGAGPKWLKNMTVGGSYRWASRAALGYLAGAPEANGTILNLDVNKPFYVEPVGNLDLNLTYSTRLFRDKVRARFQLNARNVTEDGHLQGVQVNPDGRYNVFRIVDPRQFILTTTFDF
ncbi:MAG: TonB-dependent receptor plug domain-containing protein [Opitutus sp.]